MATVTLNFIDRHAVGVALGAYPQAVWVAGAFSGQPTTTAIVDGDGSATFAGLADGAAYFAARSTGAGGLVAFTTEPPSNVTDLTASLAAKQSLLSKGVPNGYAGLDLSGKVPNINLPDGIALQPVVRDYTVAGPLTVSGGVLGMVMPTNYQALQVLLSTPSAPVGAAIYVDVNKNGTTVFSTQGNRPHVDIGSVASAIATPNTQTGVVGDRLTFDVDTIDVAAAAGAAPTWIGVDVTSPGAGITSYSLSRPAAAQLGDLCLVSFWSQSTTDPMWTPPAATGWSSAGSSFSFNSSRVHWFWRLDTGAAGPWVFTAAGSHTLSTVAATTIRGVHQTTPIDVYAVSGDNVSNPTLAVPAITTVADNVLELLQVQLSIGRTITGLDAGYTVRNGFGTSSSRHSATYPRATGGVKAGYTLTYSGNASSQVTRFGIKPPAAAAFTQINGVAATIRYLEVS